MKWAFAGDASLLRNDMRNKPFAARANVQERVRVMLTKGGITRSPSFAHHQPTKPNPLCQKSKEK